MSQQEDTRAAALHMAQPASVLPVTVGRQLLVIVVTVACAAVLQSRADPILAAALCFVAVVAVSRVVGVWELALLMPIVLSLAADGVLSSTAYLVIPAAAVVSLRPQRRRNVRGVSAHRSVGPVFLVLGVGILSLATAIGSPHADLILLGQLALLGSAVLALMMVRSYSRAWGELRSYVSASIVGLGLFLLWQVVPATTSPMDNAWALASDEAEWINRNALGMVFAAACADRAKQFLERRSRVFDASVALILFLAAGFTFSRSSYLALVVALSVVFASRARWLAMALPVSVLAVQNLPRAIEQRVRYTGSLGDVDPSSAARLELWEAATHIMLDHPFTGVGIHSLGPALERGGVGGQFAYAHNTYLTLLASLGLLLPLGAVVLALGRLYPTSRARGPLKWRWPVVVAVGIACIFGEPLLQPATAIVVLSLALLPHPSEHERCPHGDTSQDPACERYGERRHVATHSSRGTPFPRLPRRGRDPGRG